MSEDIDFSHVESLRDEIRACSDAADLLDGALDEALDVMPKEDLAKAEQKLGQLREH